ncbi:MAG: hypothetical protein ACPIOQ_51930, partial [Promethearchaeia archaeon]
MRSGEGNETQPGRTCRGLPGGLCDREEQQDRHNGGWHKGQELRVGAENVVELQRDGRVSAEKRSSRVAQERTRRSDESTRFAAPVHEPSSPDWPPCGAQTLRQHRGCSREAAMRARRRQVSASGRSPLKGGERDSAADRGLERKAANFLFAKKKEFRKKPITDLANLLARGVTAGVPVLTASSMSATDFYSLA